MAVEESLCGPAPLRAHVSRLFHSAALTDCLRKPLSARTFAHRSTTSLFALCVRAILRLKDSPDGIMQWAGQAVAHAPAREEGRLVAHRSPLYFHSARHYCNFTKGQRREKEKEKEKKSGRGSKRKEKDGRRKSSSGAGMIGPQFALSVGYARPACPF